MPLHPESLAFGRLTKTKLMYALKLLRSDCVVRNVCFVPLILLALMTPTSAAYVNIVEPYNVTVQSNSSVFIGKAGPGQTFYVTISSTTQNSTGYVLNQGWNKLVVSSLPSGWIAQNSSLYNQYPSVKLTVAPGAIDGPYRFDLTAVNVGNYSRVGSVTFHMYVNVTPDVFQLSATPTSISAGIGQPAKVYVRINNTGVSDSPFVIGMQGLPAWDSNSTVIALHRTSQNFVYQIYAGEPGVYHTTMRVSSVSSPRIYQQSNITLTVKASIPNDYAAIGEGTPAFPIIYEPAYAVMYLINLLFNR